MTRIISELKEVLSKRAVKRKRIGIVVTVTGILLFLFWISLPGELFSDPLSTVVYDRNGELLGARIAKDGQWRFPGLDSVPEKYAISLIEFEDRLFYYHPGINPYSFLRAGVQNIRAGKVVSGGSTITMQVLRMAGKNRSRTILNKVRESFLAFRLELSVSKREILQLYADNAPYGGNVVGLGAAAWRYFGTDPHNLTWSESALLAVLPNAPALIHPGRNRDLLKAKRDRLLNRLHEKGYIDELTCQLAIDEPLPHQPLPLPNDAPHITDGLMASGVSYNLYSTLDKKFQERVNEMVNYRHEMLAANQIFNLACLVMEVGSGDVIAYVGNARGENGDAHGSDVDVIRANRSTGSILKPLLFAGMIDNGDLLQTALIPDVPIRYNGYSPKNYDRGYNGAVRAYEALERSLNVPSVILLNRYGVDPFLGLLRQLGFTTFDHSRDYYGLTLILGGAETSLWELAGVYSSMARVLNNYNESDGNYFSSDYHMPLLKREKESAGRAGIHEEGLLSASSIYITFDALLKVNRPEELSLWYLMSSSRKIAWKTGTSYGFRDGWAIGVTPEYLVAVWAGNADGEGRTGLSGLTSAAPLMFDIFSLLPETSWFAPPLDNLSDAVICSESGYLAGPLCDEKDTIKVVPKGMKSAVCPYHQKIHLDSTTTFRVNSSCYPVEKMVSQNWFVLPPLMEWYYKRTASSYIELPPVMHGCNDQTVKELEIVYPQWNSHLVIPTELDGRRGKVVMEVSHRQSVAEIFWHIDEKYVGKTRKVHQLALDIAPGYHKLMVIDNFGNSESVQFEVLR